MNLEKDFIDFVELLNKHEVEHMVVGGYALAFHGEPRMTGDMDIWIDRAETNATKMVDVMNEFGMASLGFSKEDFLKEGIINQVGYPPLRIDIMNEIDGVTYRQAIADKQTFKAGKLLIFYIGRNDFIKNKEATARKKDLKDAKKLKDQSKSPRSLLPKKTPGKKKGGRGI